MRYNICTDRCICFRDKSVINNPLLICKYIKQKTEKKLVSHHRPFIVVDGEIGVGVVTVRFDILAVRFCAIMFDICAVVFFIRLLCEIRMCRVYRMYVL